MKKIDLVIVGDLAFDKIISNNNEKNSVGGAAYNASIGAVTVTKKIGIVSRVGEDFPLELLVRRGIDVEGVSVVSGGKTPTFSFYQNVDGSRSYSEERGVASEVHPEIFPQSYLTAKYIHLASAPPKHYLVWIENLGRRISNKTVISVDTFESFVETNPELTRLVLKKAGMIFINEKELNLLKQSGEVCPSVPVILKRGSLGAVYIDRKITVAAKAPKVSVVDTTGAGDVLAGTFLALRIEGVSISEALQKAVNTASNSVINFGVDHLLN